VSWAAVCADVADSGCRTSVLGEDFTVQVGDDDLVSGLVCVCDDQNLLQGAARANSVLDRIQRDGACRGDGPEHGVGG
jgi:hypothetical protein